MAELFILARASLSSLTPDDGDARATKATPTAFLIGCLFCKCFSNTYNIAIFWILHFSAVFFLLFVTHSCSVSAGGFIQVVNKINFLASEYVILVLRDSRTQFKGEERGIEIWQRDS